MQYKGAVFFDYDGTLADEKEGIYYPTEMTKNALKQLSKNGYMVVLSTGRAKCYVPDTGVNFDGYITSNGACASVGNEIIWQDFFKKEEVFEIIDKFDEMKLYYSMENNEECFAKDIHNESFIAMLDNFKIPRNIFTNLDRNNIPNVSKMLLVYNTDEELEYLSDYFEDKFLFYQHRKFLSADVTKKSIVKSVGAKAICDRFNIPKENVYAFGDGTNDYDLLKFAGHGVAMGYHSSMLDEVAEYVTDTVKDEGIYKALIHYKLIG